MASRRVKLAVSTSGVFLAAAGYFIYSVFAAQAHPDAVLAQAPLNNNVVVPPAFIMALDDSGSMHFQTLFPGRDGAVAWSEDTASYFDADGRLLEAGTSGDRNVHVAPFPAPRQNANDDRNAAIPPFDALGFSRSHQYNRSYFDPDETYLPWRNQDGSYWADADPEATRVHPASPSPTIDMTSWTEPTTTGASNSSYFRVRPGMVIPAGTRYRGSGCGLPTSNNSYREQTTDRVSTGTCSLRIGYFPATFYLHEDTPAPEGFILANRVFAPNACTYPAASDEDECNMYRYEIRPENYVGGASSEAYQKAIQNFANWYSYYGSRSRAIVAGATIALADVTNMRIGQFTINNHSSYTNPVDNSGHRLRMFDMRIEDDRIDLFDQITGLTPSGTTPNMSAVRVMGRQFQRTDTNAPIQLACQRNAGMLFTDGFTNQSSLTGYGNVDGEMGSPFQDTHSNTLADIATYYYLNTNKTIGDAGSSQLGGRGSPAAGKVRVPSACDADDPDPRLNCQANLHMNFYGITLGATGVIYDPESPFDPFENPPSWPGHVNNSANTVDDIWHATINTRGKFVNARTPAAITKAMQDIIRGLNTGTTPSGGIALTGARVGSGSLTVVPSYSVGDGTEDDPSDGTDWHGRLEAREWIVNPDTGELEQGASGWEASARLQSHEVRRSHVYFARGNGVHAFSEAHLDFADLCSKPSGLYPGMALCTAASIEAMGFSMTDVVDYLLGDESNEGVGPGSLRERTTKLGDIVHSSPVVSMPGDDYGYRTLGTYGVNYGSTYASYLSAKGDRTPMVYVGANDGMLHAFNGSVGAGGGREVFAYVPTTALGHMGNLLIPNDPLDQNDQKFQHRYYVDGPVVVSDAHLGTAGWRTVLVGTAGAGGRSVFALDVSNPSDFGASSRLWEISDLNDSLHANIRNNIGHVLGRPVVVPVRTAGTNHVRWVAIFGNGYNSASGKAVLFVVDIADGAVQMIEANEASGSNVPTGANGLGNIVVVDRFGGSGTGPDGLNQPIRDGFADTVYAADQRGAIWKFDLRAATPSAPARPLFVTNAHSEGGRTFRQPITGGLTAAVGPGGGVMLYFGTGSFSFEGDAEDTSMQSIYAVNDAVLGPVDSTLGRDDLSQVIVDWAGRTVEHGVGVPLLGWYIDLPAGERVVGNPSIAAGTVFMPTYVPDPDATGCSGGGANWLFGLNARTGGAGLSNVFSSPRESSPAHPQNTAAITLVTEGTAPVRNVGVFTLPRPTADQSLPAPPDVPGRSCWMAVAVAGADTMYLPYPCGRQSWRQIQ